jgi:hypothetical protein
MIDLSSCEIYLHRRGSTSLIDDSAGTGECAFIMRNVHFVLRNVGRAFEFRIKKCKNVSEMVPLIERKRSVISVYKMGSEVRAGLLSLRQTAAPGPECSSGRIGAQIEFYRQLRPQ